MKKEIGLSDAIGKTLEGFGFSTTSNQSIMTFTDGTFITLGICNGYNVGDEEIEESVLKLHDFGDNKLIRLGVISQEELDDKRQQIKGVSNA